MRRQILLAGSALILCWVVPGHAQNQSGATGGPDPNRSFNLHIGGGFGIPVGSTGRFAGLSGAFQIGAGPNLSKHNSVFGEFMWQGLPPSRNALAAILNTPTINPLVVNSITNLSTSKNLYALTANYMYHMEGHRYGFYLVAGGGWYYRHVALNNYTVQPGTVCEPVWDYYGYTCVNGLVSNQNTLASNGISSGGVNAGGGFTISLGGGDSYYTQFYIESRYHYSPQGGVVSTQIVPLTFGFRW
jgi:hypothetical protein